MNDLMRRLLDLNTLRWDDPEVAFAFERPLPAWGWTLVILGALVFALWSYSRLEGARLARVVLGVVRAAALILLIALLAGPQLVQRTESVERDWVLVLVDRSASMTIGDAPGPTSGSASRLREREQQLREAVQRSWPMWQELAAEKEVVWLGFDAGAFDLPVVRSSPGAPPASVDLGAPGGRRTMLGAAIEQAVARAAARPLSAIVVLSDGRTPSEPSRAILRRLQADRVPVHTVALGSEAPIGDYAVRRIDAPRLAFLNDFTPVRVDLERVGAGGAGAGGATVRLVDKATGIVLDEQRVEWDGERADQSVVLTTRPDEAGARAWTVEVDPDAPDLIAANNAAEFNIELIDRPLRVLYVDGYPRWEQRYLKNLLIREQSITCSTLILAPDRRYIQEGDIEIDALPDSPETWGEYDAIVLGDVDPGVFTDDQLAILREHVARRGGGLLWIAGPGFTPSAWWDTPLADLLPFRRAASDGGAIGAPALLAPTDAATTLGVLRLGDTADEPWPAQLRDPEAGWSQLQWVQRIDPAQLKPTAETLALAEPALGASFGGAPSEDASPAVLSMRFGAGRVIYVATDEIWRWRYARGELLPERFWLQLMRLLGRESLARSGRAASIEVSPRRADVDQPVRVAVELLDQSLVDQRIPSLVVRMARRAQAGDRAPTPPVELVLKPESAEHRHYSTIWLPPEAGDWTVTASDPSLAALDLSTSISVAVPDDELRRPEADHALLARLSAETGGQTLTVDELAELPERIPNRRVRLLNETTEALWDTPLALVSVVLLLTIEWVGRRVIRLI